MSARIAVTLLGQRRFLPLLIAQTLGAFNDNYFRYALVTLVAFQGMTVFGLSREVLVPVAASLFTIPIFLFSAMAGRVADRFDRTRILRFTKFAEIWLMGLALIGFVMGEPLVLLAGLFLMGVQSAFFAPAKNAALPTLLEGHELVPGNALISGTLNMAVLLGVGLGTVLVRGENGAWIVGGGLLIVAVIGWIAMRQLPPALPPAEHRAAPLGATYASWLGYPGFLQQGNSGLRAAWNWVARPVLILIFPVFVLITETVLVVGRVFRHPDVLRPLLGAAWFWMLAATIVTLMPIFAAVTLGADTSVVLLFSVLFTVGAALGALLCGALSGKGDALPFSLAGALGLVIFPIDIAFLTLALPPVPEGAALTGAQAFLADGGNWRLIADLGLAAISAGMFVVPLQAMAQRRAPAELRGRLLAAGGIMNAATATLGQFALAGFAWFLLPPPAGFVMVAGVSLLVAAFIAVRLWRRRRARKSDLDSRKNR